MIILIALFLALLLGAANPEAQPFASTSSQRRSNSRSKKQAHAHRQRGTAAARHSTGTHN